uniref:YwqG family protein n=1 Tax=Roseihalotalea indica TaxID=2867963 RepID=A0AA49JES9_9BACT|nr:YwqG family protein [Tunicatimonas sp. TK19036]
MNSALSSLPSVLAAYRPAIEKSLRPFIRIHAEIDEDVSITQSKFGGLPYLPEDVEYPTDEDGNPLFLLAQINCQDLPELDNFPKKGILQFYIADDDMYGLDLDEPTDQQNFRVLYFEEVDDDRRKRDFSFLPVFEDMPFEDKYSLTFEKDKAPVSPVDIHFDEVFGEAPHTFFDQYGADADPIRREYGRVAQGNGHKMGGYAHFAQEDPRFANDDFSEAILLLQIDSKNAIEWGDTGVANFFILPEDLRNLNFDNVLYNWDSL